MKYFKIILVFLLIVLAWIGIDRHRNVGFETYENNMTNVWIHDGLWTKIPEEQWIKIDRNQFNPYQAMLYVENYNLIFHSWENTIQSHISYYYKNHGEADSKPLYITETLKPHEMENIDQVTYEEMIDNIQITFGNFGNTDQVLQFETDDKIINIQFYKGDINQLKPLFESIWEDVKNNL